MMKTCVLLFFFALVTVSQANSVSRQPYTRNNVDDDSVLYQQQQQQNAPSWQAGQSAGELVDIEQRFGYGGGSAAASAHAGGGGYVSARVNGHVGVGGHVTANAAAAVTAGGYGSGGGYGNRYSHASANSYGAYGRR